MLATNIFNLSKQLLKFWKMLTAWIEEVSGVSVHSANDTWKYEKTNFSQAFYIGVEHS